MQNILNVKSVDVPKRTGRSSVFEKRVAFKPFEYPEVIQYQDALHKSRWLVTKWNFISDVQEYHTKLTPSQKNAVKNTLLAISQIEVSVKKFWTKLGDRFPKSEFDLVGTSCGENEVIHSLAYSHLLQLLNLDGEFEKILEIPAIKGRVDYLSKYLANASDTDNEKYLLTLTLFSLFIENISLFSQFAIMKSFNKHLNMLKDIDNVVQYTLKEECVHALLGVCIINLIRDEYPEWFNEEFYEKVYIASRKSLESECRIIDWIFEQGELDFLSKDTLKEFLKNRFNESVKMIGGKPIFDVDNEKLKNLKWFEDEIYAKVNSDFFHKVPVSYSKNAQSITAEDLF
jgi:ribonucleoside-diphosphate reductase beta chain